MLNNVYVGVRRSNSIEGLLPSEMRLLTGRSPKSAADEKGQNYDPSVDRPYRLQKLLFLSKFAEYSLATYEVSGWYVGYISRIYYGCIHPVHALYVLSII